MIRDLRASNFEIRTRTPAGGFTLIELLMAIFIMSIGLVAVASIFPVSSYLQKQTFEQTLTLQVKRNAEAVLYEMPVPNPSSSGNVERVSNLDDHYPLSIRCYPLVLDMDNDGTPNEAPSGSDPNEDPTFTERDLYWVPLVQKDGNQWRVFVFMLVRKDGQRYPGDGASDLANPDDGPTVPKVGKLSASVDDDPPNAAQGDMPITVVEVEDNIVDDEPLIQPGDQILSNDGTILKVLDFDEDDDGNAIKTKLRVIGEFDAISDVWFGLPPAPGQVSPTRRIIVLGEEAVD